MSAALRRFPGIAGLVSLPGFRRSELEITRLLDNTHYQHVEQLLSFVDRVVHAAGPIGQRVLQQSDPFQFHQALAELFLFAHLDACLPNGVKPVARGPSQICPDIEVARHGLTAAFEVYCPLDLMGFQLLEEYTSIVLKYLDVDRGFTVDADLRLTTDRDPYYPYSIGDETVIRRWLTTLAEKARAWLGGTAPGHLLKVDGPNGSWFLEIRARELLANPRERLVTMSTPTRSTDSRLFFECGTVDDTAKSEWGKKFSRKLAKKQCGEPAANRLRVLVVDFSLADTGWPDFICWPQINERMAQAVRRIADELGDPCPYDVVLPAQLGLKCGFAPAIWLSPSAKTAGSRFLETGGLMRPCPS